MTKHPSGGGRCKSVLHQETIQQVYQDTVDDRAPLTGISLMSYLENIIQVLLFGQGIVLI